MIITFKNSTIVNLYGKINVLSSTIKSSNFVVLFGENLCFRLIFLRLHHNFFPVSKSVQMGPIGIGRGHLGLGPCLQASQLQYFKVFSYRRIRLCVIFKDMKAYGIHGPASSYYCLYNKQIGDYTIAEQKVQVRCQGTL